MGLREQKADRRDLVVGIGVEICHFSTKLLLAKYLKVGYCPHSVTVYIKGPIRAVYNPIINTIQLLLRRGSTES